VLDLAATEVTKSIQQPFAHGIVKAHFTEYRGLHVVYDLGLSFKGLGFLCKVSLLHQLSPISSEPPFQVNRYL
jgi:hypothetical protein